MMRTRKRDDDSQYNNSITSDGTSLAFDASSMSVAGSRSSLTFASSSRRQHNRPRKRRRKTLSDALQSISLDQDVPQQILNMRDHDQSGSKNFPLRKSAASTKNNCSSNSNMTDNASWMTHDQHHNNLNARQRLDRQLDHQQENELDGDIYYDDDDNSQLTSSSEEDAGDHRIVMDEDDEDDEDDDDDDSRRKKERTMTELEKAQRKVMFELVFGRNHREARKAAEKNLEASRVATPPPLPIRIHPSEDSVSVLSPPPLATVSTTSRRVSRSLGNQAAATLPRSTSDGDSDYGDSYKDPADRKLEQLLRRSLKNIQKGTHPLALPTLDAEDGSNLESLPPLKTQDDMAIDHEIYSRRTAAAEIFAQATTAGDSVPTAPVASPMGPLPVASNSTAPGVSAPPAPPNHNADGMRWEQSLFPRKRSNSLPGDLDLGCSAIGTTDMETDH